jgi:hypothetical protein
MTGHFPARYNIDGHQDSSYCELYDIGADSYEKQDCKEENPEVVKRLLGKIADWQRTLPAKPNSACFSTERSQQSAFRESITPSERASI